MVNYSSSQLARIENVVCLFKVKAYWKWFLIQLWKPSHSIYERPYPSHNGWIVLGVLYQPRKSSTAGFGLVFLGGCNCGSLWLYSKVVFRIIVDSTNLSNELFPMNCSLSSRQEKNKDNSMMAFVKEMVKFELMLKPTFLFVGMTQWTKIAVLPRKSYPT